MVFKNINRIKNALPEIIHIAMFYNNGTIFQTTFDQEFNIPKMGENLARAVQRMRNVYEICNLKMGAEDYKKLIFETKDMSTIIIKLGEDSNLVLFFKQEEQVDKKLKSIRRYIKRIEELIDIDKYELDFLELKQCEDDIKELKKNLELKHQEKIKLEEESNKLEISEDRVKEILKNKETILEECSILEKRIEEKQKEAEIIKEKIEQKKKTSNT
ncbi:MAG: hypothetical protein JW891_03195 [Candidatus Lokiarchaeota archaeon]|nr:hypothetical protein [Candidatus Lokiarchaeota archaeon]